MAEWLCIGPSQAVEVGSIPTAGSNMPKGTKVHRCYEKLKGKKGKGSAAAICQKSTGQSLKTGKPIKGASDERKRKMG